MKIESRVILTTEELKTLTDALRITNTYCSESTRVEDSQIALRDMANIAFRAIDDFLAEYDDVYGGV